MVNLLPSTDEVKDWLLSSLRHSCQVEYYLQALDLGHDDPQRPHDITSEGSKFTWLVIKGLALDHNDDLEQFEKYVLSSIEHHRKHQYHHQKWSGPNSNASEDDMKVGAVDSLCSLLDNRAYQGGAHTFDEIIDIIKRNEPHKVKWMWMVYSQMKKIDPPDTSRIVSLHEIPNIGLPEAMYQKVILQTEEALTMLKTHGYEL